MTFLELKTLFLTYTDDPAANRWNTVEQARFLNVAQETAQNIIDSQDEDFFSKCQDYTVAPTTDSYEFALPADWKILMHAERLVSGTAPIRARVFSFKRRHSDEALECRSDGIPVIYLRGTKVGVVAPSSSYTLRAWYTKKLAALSLDADVSEIPAEYHNFLALHAAKLAAGVERKSLAPDLQDEYDRELQRLYEFAGKRQRAVANYVNDDADY